MRKGTVDYSLMIVTIILVVYGMIMVFSASYYMAQASPLYDYDGLGLFKKQLIGAGLGLVGMWFFSVFDFNKLVKWKYILFLFSVIMLLLVFIPPFGVNLNGATRWVRFGKLPSIQPSEIAKFTLIIFISANIYINRGRMKKFRYGILPNLIILGVFCIFLYRQPNYSTIILMSLIVFIMLFVGGAKGTQLTLVGLVGGIAGFLLLLTKDYRVGRLVSFTDPWQHATTGGHQVIQSLYGIGAGGIFGSGLGNGRQKLLWLPYGESDFIFSITAEELGLVGVVILMLLYIFLVYRGIKIASNAPNLLGTMMATGISVMIGLQVILNVGVVTASIPATGVPLPFMSYGNWSLMIFMCLIGIMLNISKQSTQFALSKQQKPNLVYKKKNSIISNPIGMRDET